MEQSSYKDCNLDKVVFARISVAQAVVNAAMSAVSGAGGWTLALSILEDSSSTEA